MTPDAFSSMKTMWTIYTGFYIARAVIIFITLDRISVGYAFLTRSVAQEIYSRRVVRNFLTKRNAEQREAVTVTKPTGVNKFLNLVLFCDPSFRLHLVSTRTSLRMRFRRLAR